MTENGETKGADAPNKGRFIKGYAGGPGRPKKEDAATRDLLTRIEMVVRSGMSKGELADRLKAAGLGLKLKGLKEHKVEPITTPFVLKLVGLLMDLAGRCSEEPGKPVNGLSVVDLMVKVCPTCTLICKAKGDSEIFSE